MLKIFKKSIAKKPGNNIDFKNKSIDKDNEDSKAEELKENPSRSLIVNTAARDTRQALRGPKLRFVEDADYNLNLIKYLVPSPELVCETIKVGSLAPKHIDLIYLKNVANSGIVEEIKNRIRSIKTRTLFDSSYVQRNIEDSGLSPFPQVEITNRPDVAQSALWQGRIAISLDGSPDILLAPCTFFELVDTPDDAYSRWFFATSFFKFARYIMLLFALALPGFYIALLSFNTELVPTRLLLLVINSRAEVPFPIYFEAFLMMGIAEAIRMMMIRIPSQIGSTVALFAGIALVIAGLYAHVIGPMVVIIATLTVISSFGIPDYDLRSAIRIFQFFTMIMSTILGLFGFAASFFIVCIHLVTLKSFGISYMAPLAPAEASGWGHVLWRENTRKMPVDETFKPYRAGRRGAADE